MLVVRADQVYSKKIDQTWIILEPNKEYMKQDLEHHAEILSEAIQNYLRANGCTDAYEQTKENLQDLIDQGKEAPFSKQVKIPNPGESLK